FPTTLLDLQAASGDPVDVGWLLAAWSARTASPVLVGGPERRAAGRRADYPWPLTIEAGSPRPAYLRPNDAWHAWRPAEAAIQQADPDRFVARLIEPLVITESAEFLETMSAVDGLGQERAQAILVQALPAIRRSLAAGAAQRHAWADTFALWAVTRRPRILRRVHPFALAIADGAAARALIDEGIGRGSDPPFVDRPLASVSGQLASALIALGLRPKLAAALIGFVKRAEDPLGGWGDGGGPVDVLTTVVGAELLSQTDPEFDPSRTMAALCGLQDSDGWWRAAGPDAVWTTRTVAELLIRLELPFAQRWQWPQLAVEHRDRRTGLAWGTWLADLGRLMSEVGGLARAPIEIAFIDLAGFGLWNTRFGQPLGDRVLRSFAQTLAEIPGAVSTREGGDEFVVLGAPTGTGLEARMKQACVAWQVRFRTEYGTQLAPVRPRILVTSTRGAGLLAARDALGFAIGTLKARWPDPPDVGVIEPVSLKASR
ncbi:MAG TPA: diguanylate cyclase, partial [Candidatus Limnocylindrales bacterium]|nr:diguanylate cyclase [Candidatus Limnocylindrales bacterium]